MAKAKPNAAKPEKEFKAGKGFTKEDWDAVSDNPEWTEEDFRNASPFADVFPYLAESIRRSRGRRHSTIRRNRSRCASTAMWSPASVPADRAGRAG